MSSHMTLDLLHQIMWRRYRSNVSGERWKRPLCRFHRRTRRQDELITEGLLRDLSGEGGCLLGEDSDERASRGDRHEIHPVQCSGSHGLIQLMVGKILGVCDATSYVLQESLL